MKFWELVSVCRGQDDCLNVLNCEIYSEYWSWYLAFDELVDSQDRAKLNYRLSDTLVLDVLRKHTGCLYLSKGYLRARRLDFNDTKLSISDAFSKYGGSKIEQAFERAMIKVS